MIRELFEHVENSRDILLDATQKLDEKSFLDRQKGMSSIRDLLVHLMDAEDYWIGSVILGEKRQKFLPDKYEDVANLKANWEIIRGRTRKLVSDMSTELLSGQVTVQWEVAREREEARRVDIGTVLLHLLTHELRHHGQVCLLMRQEGCEPPCLDLF